MKRKVNHYPDELKLKVLQEYLESEIQFRVRKIAHHGIEQADRCSRTGPTNIYQKKAWHQTITELYTELEQINIDALCGLFGKSRQALTCPECLLYTVALAW
jgi:hypothetical protein